MLDEQLTTESNWTVDDDHKADSPKADHSATLREARQASLAGRTMRFVLRSAGNPAIEIVLWSGERISTSMREPIARLHVKDRSTLLKLFAHPDIEFGEAYSAGRIAVEGDLTGLIEEVYRGQRVTQRSNSTESPIEQRLRRSRSNTFSGARDNIHHHYDIGNDFYALWLGETMAYTCAYFSTPTATLEQAQVAKMDHVCRKLRLRSGEVVVEAGCGWGSLALHMARHYGVKVRAFNISHEQIAYAREQAKRQNLSGQVEFIEDDYRNIGSAPNSRYDAFVSVGMLEHVGPRNFSDLGRLINNCLTSSGRGFIHTIGRDRSTALNAWIEKRIFPGARPPSLKEMMDIFEAADCSVLDVENLRLHYSKTLQAWRANFERTTDRAAKMFDEKFVRMWRLYLAGSEAAFNTGEMQLFQVLFAPRVNNEIAWTRDDIYQY